jgi:hypothetical protein
MKSIINLFDLGIPYIDVKPVDYKQLLSSCTGESFDSRYILPNEDFEENELPKLSENFDFEKAFKL